MDPMTDPLPDALLSMSSMTDVSIGMMSYYNPLAMYRQPQHHESATSATAAQQQLSQQAQQQAEARHAAMHQQAAAAAAVVAASADTSPSQQYWYGYPHGHLAHAAHHHHHHQTTAPQPYLDHAADVLAWSHHPHYSHHLQYQHQQAAYQQHHHHHQQQAQLSGALGEWSSDESTTHMHHLQQDVITGEPSPPITISGSEISSPGTPSSPSGQNNNNSHASNNSNENNDNNSASSSPVKPGQVRSPFEWMNKPSYQSQPNPGKTRTKDKYRVVYTDHQRLELEKEFHFSRYITIRRKAELAANLALSERQVKIWFQNRRAKERKQSKKRGDKQEEAEDVGGAGGMAGLAALGGMGGMLGGLMHEGGSPPLNLGPPPHGLRSFGLSPPLLHPHINQHTQPHPVLGL